MSLAFRRFEVIFQSKSFADACGLCRQDAFSEFTTDLGLGFRMLLGHLTLRPFVLHGLEANQTRGGSQIGDMLSESTLAGNH